MALLYLLHPCSRIPDEAFPLSCAKHSNSSSLFIRWYRLVNWQPLSALAFLVMRCSFVDTLSTLLCMIRVSPLRCCCRDDLSFSPWMAYMQTMQEQLSVQIHYALSSILCHHPTSWLASVVLVLLSLVQPTLFFERQLRISRVADNSQCPACHALQPRSSPMILVIRVIE